MSKKRSKGKQTKAQARRSSVSAAASSAPASIAPDPAASVTAKPGGVKAATAKGPSAKTGGAKAPSAKAGGAKPMATKPAATKPAATKPARPATAKLVASHPVPAAPTAKPAVIADDRAPRPRVAAAAEASPRSWSVASTIGWFVATTLVALLALDGDLDSVRDLVLPGRTPPVASTPGVGPATSSPEAEAPPPLPPPPDLAPTAPAVAGVPPAPEPGVNLEERCAAPDAPSCGSYALDTVYAALARTEAATADRPVRIAFYGDSVSAADAIPGRLRARLQAVFGDGGPGFLHAVAPHRYNYSQQMSRSSSGTWNVRSVVSNHIADQLYGLGLSTVDGAGTLRWRLRDDERAYSRVELAYLARPGGGAADLIVDGEVAASVDTASEIVAPAYQPLRLADGNHKLDLKTTRGKVRLFGVTFERTRGVVVDNLAVVSATANNLQENLAAHWRDQLARRSPDLVVFMLGTNEAQWIAGARKMGEYEQEWAQLLATIRAGRPEASCLVISPLDQAEVKDGRLIPRRAMPRMIATQRRAAAAAGCAFWDTFTWMGGSGAAIKWNQRGLLGSDFAHPSPQGMAMVADAVADALVSGYRAYKGRSQP